MKKYVSPELNVELFDLVDMIMESGKDFNGGTGNGTDNQNPDEVIIPLP